MITISSQYSLPTLSEGDYFFVQKTNLSRTQQVTIIYHILNSENIILLETECTLSANGLESIVLSTPDVYRPIAKISKLTEDAYTVDIGGPVGTIDKAVGWQFQDIDGCKKFSIMSEDQKPTHALVNFLSVVVSFEPVRDFLPTIYRIRQNDNADYFASFYADLNNLELKAVKSELTPYICIFLVLLTKLE